MDSYTVEKKIYIKSNSMWWLGLEIESENKELYPGRKKRFRLYSTSLQPEDPDTILRGDIDSISLMIEFLQRALEEAKKDSTPPYQETKNE